MSGPEVATKAPESDAMEDIPTTDTPPQPSSTTNASTATQPSAISSTDSAAQSGPTMGDHCTSDRPIPTSINTQSSSGTITTLNSIETYISKPADYPSTPAKLLLLLTSGTGIHSLNNQLQADRFASSGYLVIMPDQFNGDPAPNSTNRVTSPSATSPSAFIDTLPTTNDPPPPRSPSLLDRIKLTLADTAKSFVLDMWLARHTPETVLPRVVAVLQAVQEEYADAIAHGGGIYGMGYCFGAKYILILAGEGGAEAHESLQGKGLDFAGLSAALPAMPALPKGVALPGMLGGGGGGGTKAAEGTTASTKSSQEADLEAGAPAAAADSTITPAEAGSEAADNGNNNDTETTPSLPQTQAPTTIPPLKAAALAHPTLVTAKDILSLSPSVPTLLLAVQNDPLFSEELLDTARKAWAANTAECRIEVFDEGIPHGFAVVGEYEDQRIREEQERGWGLVRGWFDAR